MYRLLHDIDSTTIEKVNFNISACNQARKIIQTATGMFFGSAVSIVILQKVQNVKKTQKINMCIYTNLKKDARHAEKNEHVHAFENDVRLTRVFHASMTRR